VVSLGAFHGETGIALLLSFPSPPAPFPLSVAVEHRGRMCARRRRRRLNYKWAAGDRAGAGALPRRCAPFYFWNKKNVKGLKERRRSRGKLSGVEVGGPRTPSLHPVFYKSTYFLFRVLFLF
jgi:hypothetical protein